MGGEAVRTLFYSIDGFGWIPARFQQSLCCLGACCTEPAPSSSCWHRPSAVPPNMQTWVYPSEQMFYNAMKRKGWQPSEDDMAAVVAIHNAGAARIVPLLPLALPLLGRSCAAARRPLACQLAQVPRGRSHANVHPCCMLSAKRLHSLCDCATTCCGLCLAAVNERAWREILRWEAAHGGAAACGGPRLLKFRCGASMGSSASRLVCAMRCCVTLQ